MVAKKRGNKKKKIGQLKGFSIQFVPYSDIRGLSSNERIKKILDIVLENNIILLQGRLLPEEETRLIGDTMAMIGHIKGFNGIELAVISENGNEKFRDKLRRNVVKLISGGDMGAITLIGPASIVREVKKDPKKIELLLNK